MAGEGAYGRAQLPHDGGGVDAVAHDVPDDQAGAAAGQLDDVVPVAADVVVAGGQVAAGQFQAGDLGQGAVAEAALERQGGPALVGVHPGVVDVERRAGDHLVEEHAVLLVEGLAAAQPCHGDRAEHGAAGDERDQPGGAEGGEVVAQFRGARVGDQRVHVGHVQVHGPPLGDDLLVDRLGRDLEGLAGCQPGGGGVRVGELDRDAAQHALVGGRGVVGREDGLQQLYVGRVGQLGYEDLHDLPGGLVQVEGGADAGAGLGEDGEAAAGPLGLDLGLLALGDVDEGGDHAERAAGAVEQRGVRAGPGVVVLGVGRGAAGAADVDDGGAPVHDLLHRRLERDGVDAGHDLGEPFAEVVGGRDAVHPGQCVVDPQEAQVGAEGGEADGRLGEEALEGGERVPHAQDLGGLHGDQHGPRTALRVDGGDDPHLHGDAVPVAVAYGEGADHRLTRLDAPGQVVGELLVGLGDEYGRAGAAEDVLGAVAEQVLGGERPFDDESVGVLPPEGDRQQLAEHTGVPDSRDRLIRDLARRLVCVHRTDLTPGGLIPTDSPYPSDRRGALRRPVWPTGPDTGGRGLGYSQGRTKVTQNRTA